MDDIVTRLRHKYAGQLPICAEAADEIERLNREVLQLQGVVRAHEGMYARAAEQIDLLRGWLERSYRLAVGHGPNWDVFDSWEEAIDAYEEARRG